MGPLPRRLLPGSRPCVLEALTRAPLQEFEPWYENGMQLKLIRATPPEEGGAGEQGLPASPEDPRDIAALCSCEQAVQLAVPRDGSVGTLRACAARKVRVATLDRGASPPSPLYPAVLPLAPWPRRSSRLQWTGCESST